MTAQTQVDVVVLGAGLAGLSAAATAAAEGASTFGGIEVAAEGTVVDASGRPVRGLYAAGADMGDAYHEDTAADCASRSSRAGARAAWPRPGPDDVRPSPRRTDTDQQTFRTREPR